MSTKRNTETRARDAIQTLRGAINQAIEANVTAAFLPDGEPYESIKTTAMAMAGVARSCCDVLSAAEELFMPEGAPVWSRFARVLTQADVEDALVDAIETGAKDYQSFEWQPVNQGMARTRELAEQRCTRWQEKNAIEYARRSIAATLKAARRHAGLTKAELAKIIGRSQSLVMGAEGGFISVDELYVVDVLKACGLPEDWRGPHQ
jgi:DNA-binding XRE family transcriptional regulator